MGGSGLVVRTAAPAPHRPVGAGGASDLLIDVFGPRGKRARSAIGTNPSPFGIPIEIEMIVALERGA